jgi:hypothetical protein
MTSDQIAKANMCQAVNLILTAPSNQPVWSGLPAFVRAQAQGSALTGIALDKDRLALSLVNRTLITADAAEMAEYNLTPEPPAPPVP